MNLNTVLSPSTLQVVFFIDIVLDALQLHHWWLQNGRKQCKKTYRFI